MKLQNNKFLIYFSAFIVFLPQVTLAQLAPVATAAKMIAEETGGMAESFGAKSLRYVQYPSGEVFMNLLDKDGQLIKRFVIPKAAPEAMAAARPSTLMQKIGKMRADRMNAGKTVVATGKVATKAWNALNQPEGTFEPLIPKLARNLKANKQAILKKSATSAVQARDVAIQELYNFPFEAFTFFVALGAQSTMDLVFNYNNNPVAYDQLLDSQTNPVGQLGFAAFMVSRGLSTTALQSAMDSKRLRNYLPMLGMSVGYLAQQVVTDFATVPGLAESMKACASADLSSCDKAYDLLTTSGLNMMPSLVSMMGATLLVGVTKTVGMSLAAKTAETVAVNAGKMAMGRTVRVVGLRIGMALLTDTNAVGWTINGLMWTEQIAEMAGFIDTSSWIEVPLTHLWNNYEMVGPDLKKINAKIVQNVKNNNFSHMPDDLQKFGQLMNAWRENNSAQTMNAHNQWTTFLEQLSTKYNLAKKFYQDFTDDLWRFRFQPNSGETIDISRKFPLYGVKLPTGKDVPYYGYLNLPDEREADQIKTLNSAANIIYQQIGRRVNKLTDDQVRDLIQDIQQSNPLQRFLTMPDATWVDKLSDEELSYLVELNNDFASDDLVTLKRGIDVLNMLTWNYQHPNDAAPSLGDNSQPMLAATLKAQGLYSENLMLDGMDPDKKSKMTPGCEAFLNALVDKVVGHATPLMEPGSGILHILATMYASLNYKNAYPDLFHYVDTALPTEYLTIAMVTGPDAQKENLIKSNMRGFKADFIPPRIITNDLGDPQGVLRNLDSNPANQKSYLYDLFHLGFGGSQAQAADGSLPNPFEILQSPSTSPWIFGYSPDNGAKGTNIQTWWSSVVEPQYMKAWTDYENKYRSIVISLYNDLWKDKMEWSNPTPFSSGLIKSTDQENMLYLSMLWHFAGDPKKSPYASAFTDLQAASQKLEARLKGILQVVPDRNPRATRGNGIGYKTVITHIPATDLDAADKDFKAKIKDLIENKLMKDPQNSSDAIQKTLKALEKSMFDSYALLVNYGKIINTASYKSRLDKDGNDTGAAPVKLQGAPTTTNQFRTDLGDATANADDGSVDGDILSNPDQNQNNGNN